MALLSRFSVIGMASAVMLAAGSAMACDYCGGGYYGSGYYRGHAVYSCNNALYDCRVESSYYTPRCDGGCGYGYGGHAHAYRRGYRDGFHDGYETASYDEDDRGFYDGDHHFHAWERWRDGDGHWRDGWHDDKGAWHDREARDEHHDGDRFDHDGDHHDGGYDDHHDGDHYP